jgi:glycosyltransferase involved in cell wall biosynthesis
MQGDSPVHHRRPTNKAALAAPLVSVVIPAYNCAHTVAETIESCLAQDYEEMEILVVNDGSTDETPEVLASFGSRIKVINQPNGGLAAARNAGQRAASGKYLAWMDADDLMLPGRVRLQAELLASQPTIGLVSSDFSAFTSPEADYDPSHMANYYDAVVRLGGVYRVYPHELASMKSDGRTVIVRSGDVYEGLIWGNFVHPPTVMVRRTVLEEAGFSDEHLRYSSDYELILRMSRRTRFAYVDAPLLRYRRSAGQMSHLHAGAMMQLETVHIIEKLRRDDPEVFTRMKPVFLLRRAESFIHAAESIGSADRIRAMGLLVRGLQSKLLAGPAAFALGRIVVSPAVLQAIKHALRALGLRWVVLACAALWGDGGGLWSLGAELI